MDVIVHHLKCKDFDARNHTGADADKIHHELHVFSVDEENRDIVAVCTKVPVRTFADKVMSLLFSMLCSFVVAFLPRNKNLLILLCL